MELLHNELQQKASTDSLIAQIGALQDDLNHFIHQADLKRNPVPPSESELSKIN